MEIQALQDLNEIEVLVKTLFRGCAFYTDSHNWVNVVQPTNNGDAFRRLFAYQTDTDGVVTATVRDAHTSECVGATTYSAGLYGCLAPYLATLQSSAPDTVQVARMLHKVDTRSLRKVTGHEGHVNFYFAVAANGSEVSAIRLYVEVKGDAQFEIFRGLERLAHGSAKMHALIGSLLVKYGVPSATE